MSKLINKRINPIDFINRYNNFYKKSFILSNDMKTKKSVSIKSLISYFLPILRKNYLKSLKLKKGGNLLEPPATDTISYATNEANNKNFFNIFPRNPPYTSVYNGFDLSVNQVANEYPAISTYSRTNF